jgi:hypothetical protein
MAQMAINFGFKQFLWNYCPPLFHVGRWLRSSMHRSRQKNLAAQILPLHETILKQCGFVVQTGPFRGMKYEPQTRHYPDSFLPRLVGSYEAQTHDAIETALRRSPSAIIDIGCEEGYCAVGFALRHQGKVFAYDIENWARESCRKLARLNGVADRLEIGGACTCQSLQATLPPNAFVLCDCEGYELELLDPVKVPALATADVLVELHDFVRLDLAMTPIILDRFRDTHDITMIEFGNREPGRYPCLECLPREKRPLALHEDRMPGQQWAFLKSRSRTSLHR